MMIRTKLPKDSLPLLKFIENNGPLSQKSILESLKFPIRKLRYLLNRLVEDGILRRIPNLNDMRSVYYDLSIDNNFLESLLVSTKKSAKTA